MFSICGSCDDIIDTEVEVEKKRYYDKKQSKKQDTIKNTKTMRSKDVYQTPKFPNKEKLANIPIKYENTKSGKSKLDIS